MGYTYQPQLGALAGFLKHKVCINSCKEAAGCSWSHIGPRCLAAVVSSPGLSGGAMKPGPCCLAVRLPSNSMPGCGVRALTLPALGLRMGGWPCCLVAHPACLRERRSECSYTRATATPRLLRSMPLLSTQAGPSRPLSFHRGSSMCRSGIFASRGLCWRPREEGGISLPSRPALRGSSMRWRQRLPTRFDGFGGPACTAAPMCTNTCCNR